MKRVVQLLIELPDVEATEELIEHFKGKEESCQDL